MYRKKEGERLGEGQFCELFSFVGSPCLCRGKREKLSQTESRQRGRGGGGRGGGGGGGRRKRRGEEEEEGGTEGKAEQTGALGSDTCCSRSPALQINSCRAAEMQRDTVSGVPICCCIFFGRSMHICRCLWRQKRKRKRGMEVSVAFSRACCHFVSAWTGRQVI